MDTWILDVTEVIRSNKWEKMFTVFETNKDSVSKIYKELLQINNNKKASKIKMGRGSKQVIYR